MHLPPPFPMDENVAHEMCFGKERLGRLISTVKSCKKVKYGNFLVGNIKSGGRKLQQLQQQ
jgi:hypothetical protein